MGCDIHAFIEHKTKKSDYWQNFGEEFRLDRDYGVFATLANVRNYEEFPHFEPKGLPQGRMGWKTRDAAFYRISDYVCTECQGHFAERTVSRTDAEEQISKGYATLVEEDYITDSDWHSHSWMTVEEYEKALKMWSEKAKYEVSFEYMIVLEVMKTFERKGHDARLIFWFDN